MASSSSQFAGKGIRHTPNIIPLKSQGSLDAAPADRVIGALGQPRVFFRGERQLSRLRGTARGAVNESTQSRYIRARMVFSNASNRFGQSKAALNSQYDLIFSSLAPRAGPAVTRPPIRPAKRSERFI
jgi:hypothetical protein